MAFQPKMYIPSDFKPEQPTTEIKVIGMRFVNDLDLEFLIHWPDGSTTWIHEDICPYPDQISDFFRRFEKSFKLLKRVWHPETQ